jgi:molecular chaperone Hsp33
LLDWPVEQLLSRLFHADDPTVVGGRDLRFACSCSRERVAGMLQSLGETEATAAVIDGEARIRCEFCGQSYTFGPADIHAMFTAKGRPMEPPERLQ